MNVTSILDSGPTLAANQSGNATLANANTAVFAPTSPSVGPPPGGGLLSAVLSALSGTVTTSSAAGASSSTDVAQDFKTFVQALVTALKSQGSSGSTSKAADGAGTTGSANAGSGLSSAVDSLIQSLGNSSSGEPTAGSTTDSLQSAFDKLVGDLGGTGGSANLTSFLQALSTDVQSTSTRGNLVNATA